MKNQATAQTVEKRKVIAITALFVASITIVIIGVSFGVFSLLNSIEFSVLNSQVHGAVFGMVIAFLGARYFFSVQKLKAEVYKTTSRFSWRNFKKR